jgi:hypothetical protein
MSYERAEKERKRNRWIEAIWTVLLLFGIRTEANKSRYKSELEEEIEEKTEEEEQKKRNESDLEQEYDMAK